jgi:hypothetical protein
MREVRRLVNVRRWFRTVAIDVGLRFNFVVIFFSAFSVSLL